MHEQRIGRAQLKLELAHCLEERLAFDVARGAAHFHHRNLGIPGSFDDPMFDFISDVRNNLNGAAQIIAPALLAQHCVIDTARRKIIGAAHHRAREALVMTEIEVCLRAIVGDEDLSMLERAHRAGVDVDVGV